jgi:hypothetical protein
MAEIEFRCIGLVRHLLAINALIESRQSAGIIFTNGKSKGNWLFFCRVTQSRVRASAGPEKWTLRYVANAETRLLRRTTQMTQWSIFSTAYFS